MFVSVIGTKPVPKTVSRANLHDVKIVWNDGHESLYIARDLRLRCPCAVCVEEMSGRPLLDPDTVAPDVHPLGISLVGKYAIHIQWSDGHSTGIYTFDSLRRLCPCPSCAS